GTGRPPCAGPGRRPRPGPDQQLRSSSLPVLARSVLAGPVLAGPVPAGPVLAGPELASLMLAGPADRPHDVLVPGAPAELAGQRLADLFRGRIGVGGEQPPR